MKNTVSVSIITLTKNRAKLLEKCLTSIKDQISVNDEVILIDNCSTDNTKSVIASFLGSFMIRSYTTSLSGYANLYNFATNKATKPIVVFLDDDCIASPGYVARIRAHYQKKCDFVIQGKTLSLPENTIFSDISEDHLTNWMESNKRTGNTLAVLDNRNVAIPKSVLKKFGGFSVAMGSGSEDVELGRRLFDSGVSIIYDPALIAYHHERETIKDFLAQHARIAQSHAILDSYLPTSQKISIINKHTWKKHAHSFIIREIIYWRQKRYRDAIYLPIVYLLLILTRIIGYMRFFNGKHIISIVWKN